MIRSLVGAPDGLSGRPGRAAPARAATPRPGMLLGLPPSRQSSLGSSTGRHAGLSVLMGPTPRSVVSLPWLAQRCGMLGIVSHRSRNDLF